MNARPLVERLWARTINPHLGLDDVYKSTEDEFIHTHRHRLRSSRSELSCVTCPLLSSKRYSFEVNRVAGGSVGIKLRMSGTYLVIVYGVAILLQPFILSVPLHFLHPLLSSIFSLRPEYLTSSGSGAFVGAIFVFR